MLDIKLEVEVIIENSVEVVRTENSVEVVRTENSVEVTATAM